jgi:MFS family permease
MTSNGFLEENIIIRDTGKKIRAPLLNNVLILFMVAMVLANISGFMYGALLPLYLTDLNANVVQVGLFYTLIQIISLALQIFGGWISDSLGRLRSIAIGSVAGIISYVGLILAPSWQWVILGEGLAAITRSLVAPSFNAFIAEQSSEQNRARVYGVTEAIFQIVSVIGPPLGGFLANRFGFKIMLLCAAIIYVFATYIRVSMARNASKITLVSAGKLSFKKLYDNLGVMIGLVISGGLITWILITDGVRDIAYGLSGNLLPIYLQEIGGLDLQKIGLLEAVFGIFMMLTTIPAGWLADKKGEKVAIASGFFLQFITLNIFVRVSGFLGFAIAWSFFGMSIGLMSPAYNSLISKAIPEKYRGTAFGLFSTSIGIISLPAPIIGAQLWEQVRPEFPFLITAYLSLLAVIPVYLKFNLSKNEDHQT